MIKTEKNTVLVDGETKDVLAEYASVTAGVRKALEKSIVETGDKEKAVFIYRIMLKIFSEVMTLDEEAISEDKKKAKGDN